MIKISNQELLSFSSYIKKISGINLDKTKSYLLESRLKNLLNETNSSSFFQLYRKIQGDRTGVLKRKIIDAITTKETLFFRDKSLFELLQYKILPDIINRKNGGSITSPLNLRILHAACSTGQEVYSVAMVLSEILGDPNRHNISLMGIDISDEAIKKASYGVYNQFEVERGVPGDFVRKYFQRERDDWKIKDNLRSLATFNKHNLLDAFSNMGKFDIIFCRNVAIYFDNNDKIRLFDSVMKLMDPRGSLIVGSTEVITGICPGLESKRYLRSVYYQLKNKSL